MSIPLILDTDIGTDVDDVWALVFLLNCPEVDVKLITTCTGDTEYRACLVAKILKELGREDIPIGIGLSLDHAEKTHSSWLDDFSLEDFEGEVYRDGVGAICETIAALPERSILLSIGPLPNVSAALARSPQIAERSRFVGMHGSLRRGYLGAQKPAREYNARLHALSCKHVFESNWDKTITPLDSCGDVFLEGDRFARLLNSESNSARIVSSAHFSWLSLIKDWPVYQKSDMQKRSSILFDCVAVYLCLSEEWLKMENLPILVTEDGKTMIDEKGNEVSCATDWIDREQFLDLLVDRLV